MDGAPSWPRQDTGQPLSPTPSEKKQRPIRARPAHSKACARCRRRKIKCDFALPSCSACKSASVPCMGYDTTLKREVPRSMVTYLEEKAAALEIKIKEVQAHNAQTSPHGTRADSRTYLSIGSALAASLSEIVAPLASGENPSALTLYHAFHLRQCSLPLPFPHQTHHPNRDEIEGSEGSSTPRPTHLPSVPRAAADLMLKNYTEIHLPQYPCVYEPDLLNSYSRCFNAPTTASSYDVFIVCMAFAISANTLIWRNEKNALSASAGFFAKAKEQLQFQSTYDTDMKKIQIALLLTHYSFTNPTATDVWYCVGDAARLCVQLGFHKEVGPGAGLNTLEIDTRRRLFWTTFGMERGICSNLRLPFHLDEATVTTQFPSSLADNCILPSGFKNGPHKKASALHFWQYRILETEGFRVLYLLEPPPTLPPASSSFQYTHPSDRLPAGAPPTFEAWRTSYVSRLRAWHTHATQFAPEQKLEFRNIQLNHLLGRVNRPTPANRYPSASSRVEYIRAVKNMIDDYAGLYRHRRLFYPWFAAHILFEMAVVVMETVWGCGEWLPSHGVDLWEIIRMIEGLPGLLRDVAKFWPAVKSCADTVEALAIPVTARLEIIARGNIPGPPDEGTTNTLMRYLFPESDLGSVTQRPTPTVPREETPGISLLAAETLMPPAIGQGENVFAEFDWNEPLQESLFDMDEMYLWGLTPGQSGEVYSGGGLSQFL